MHISGTTLFYHYIKTDSVQKGLIIFLHGSVRAFKGQNKSEPISIDILTEGNKDLIPTLKARAYDIIIPIAYNDYNWLEPKGKLWIDTLSQQYAGHYNSIFISGFSDGGTGAYRYFYQNPQRYNGVLIFNGYPQLNMFSQSVDYRSCNNKHIVFVSQAADKVVPYEFLLTEYRRQKMVNEHTYFILKQGKHQFARYTKSDFEQLIDLLEYQTALRMAEPDSIWIYPVLDALMLDNKVTELYTFRSKIGKRYGMNPTEYANQNKALLKNKSTNIKTTPFKIARKDFSANAFTIHIEVNGQLLPMVMTNWLKLKTWNWHKS